MLSKLNKLKFWETKGIPIFLKLTIIYAFIFSVSIALISIVTFEVSKYIGLRKTKDYIEKTSEEVSEYIKQGEPISRKIYKEVDLKGPVDVKIYDGKENLLFKTRPHLPDIENKINLGTIATTDLERSNRKNKEAREEYRVFYLNRKILTDDKVFYLQVIFSVRGRDDFFNVLLMVLIGINAAAVILSIIVGSYIAQKILQPIGEIGNTARKITINDLDKRIDTSGPKDEIRELAGAFNNMIDRLQESIEKQNQFISDASHELRTPISVIQGYIDLLDRWGKEDEEVLEESIKAIKVETVNMKKLLEQLLYLARGDKEEYDFVKEKFKLNELIAEVYEETKLIDEEHKIILKENEEVEIKAEAKSIKQLLRIIIDNSLKYTDFGGKIIINSNKKDSWIEITIEDTGEGIARKDIDRIFDRFYRADESRNRETGGVGLGLSIAKWIVESHKGEITVESELNKGTKMIVKLLVDDSEDI